MAAPRCDTPMLPMRIGPGLYANHQYGGMQDFGRQIARLGTDPGEQPAYRELWSTVAPADRRQDGSL